MAHRRAAQYSISFRTRQGLAPSGWLALPLAQNLRAAFYSIRRPAHPRLCTKPQENVDFYWLDDSIEGIELGEDKVTIHWRDGETSITGMEFSEARYKPTSYTDFYNDFLERVRRGEKKVKYKFLMGLAQ